MKKLLSIVVGLFFIPLLIFSQKTYSLDKYHARVSFSATHLGISHVVGNFKTFNATLASQKEDFTDALITLSIDVASINTDVEHRDNDLKSDNYFDAQKFPTIEFKSTAFKKLSEKKYKLYGNIKIHGVTKAIVFDVAYNGKAVNMMKSNSTGFTINGKLDRLDFGVGASALLTGVSNEIELTSNVEFTYK